MRHRLVIVEKYMPSASDEVAAAAVATLQGFPAMAGDTGVVFRISTTWALDQPPALSVAWRIIQAHRLDLEEASYAA